MELDDDDVELTVSGCGGIKSDEATNTLEHKPLHILAKWKDLRTRDGSVALLVLLPSGTLESDEGVKAEIERATAVNLVFKWPAVMLDHMKLTKALLTFCTDMNLAHGTLLGQGLMDCTEKFHLAKENELNRRAA